MTTIKYKKLSQLAKEPFKKYDTDACFDVYATSFDDLGNGVVKYGIGLSIEIPLGMRLDLRPRSSIFKTGLMLSNSIGTGDYGYTGEYCFFFYNVLPNLPNYEIGDRIGQIHIETVHPINFLEVQELKSSDRGNSGFGSTGLK